MFNNLKQIKSTLIGMVLIGFAIYMLLHQQTFNLYFASGLIVAGILLCLSPDRFLDAIQTFIGIGEDKLKKKN